MLSKLPAIEHKNADMSATIEKADANEVQVEESKTSEAISESKVHGVEEIQEIGPSLTVGNTHTDKVEEIKEAPDTIFKPTYQCVEAVIDRDITINQTLPTQRNEQLQEPSSALPKEQNHETPTNVELIKDESTKKDETQPNENVACSFPKSITEKPCLQDEGPRELDVSNLELKAHESQNKAPEEESIALEETSTVEPQEYIPEIKCADCPMEYEIIPIQCSSQGTSKDEDIINSGDSNKESDNLPPPYAAVKDLLQGEVGEMCEESSNLKFEKTAKVLESVSEIHSPEVPPTSEGIEIIEEQLKGVITETRDGRNHSEETTEADEAIKKDTSNGKAIDEEHKQITEENPVARNSHPVSPHEETVAKSNQEDELRAEDYPGKRTNITFEIIENEIQHEEMFEESEEAGEDKYIKETITTEDKTFKDGKVSVGDGTANVSPPEEAEDGKNIEKVPNRLDHENKGDETNFEDAATEATTSIKEGCDASILLDGSNSEKTAPINLHLRGFDIIDAAKAAVEAVCPGVVSCADIIVMATRDSVAKSKGVRYDVQTGRRDGFISLAQNTVDIPTPNISVSDSIKAFDKKGLGFVDMVYLLGAHTVGVAHCSTFIDRLYNFKNTGKPDPSMNDELLTKLRSTCPQNATVDNIANLDQNPRTSIIVDNSYYYQILKHRGVLQIDQELVNDLRTVLVVLGATLELDFNIRFPHAMVNLGKVQVLTGTEGEIRKSCPAVNNPTTMAI